MNHKLAKLERCAKLRARIIRNVEVEPISGCWLWKGRRNNVGYGIITVRRPGYRTPRPMFVHRVSWEAFHERSMPRGRVGAHSYRCVSQACANWEHVRATTQSHNCRDKKRSSVWRQRVVRMEFPPLHTLFRSVAQ